MKKAKNFSFLMLTTFAVFIPAKISNKNENDQKNISYKTQDIAIAGPDNFTIGDFETNYYNSAVSVHGGLGDNIYTWGDSLEGQLGIGATNEINYNTPQLLTQGENSIPTNIKVDDIEIGLNYMGVVLSDDQTQYLYMWGDNSTKQINQKTESKYYIPQLIWESSTSAYTIENLELGEESSLILLSDGTTDYLYSWGSNAGGLLGIGLGNGEEVFAPTLVQAIPSDQDIVELNVGKSHAGAITREIDGTEHLYMWGSNTYGQLGFDPETDIYYEPTEVTGFSGQELSDLQTGRSHTGIIADGSMYFWGDNSYGQLGEDPETTQMSFEPVQVNILGAQSYTDITIGNDHNGAIIVNTDGEEQVYTWGNDSSGQLGINNNPSLFGPNNITSSLVSDLSIPYDIVDISFGGDQSMALVDQANTENFYVWGQNIGGQLGLGDYNDRLVPTNTFFLPSYVTEADGGMKRRTITANSYALQLKVYDKNNMLEDIVDYGKTNIKLFGDFHTNSMGNTSVRDISVYDDVAPTYNEENSTWTLDYFIDDIEYQTENTVNEADGLGLDINLNQAETFAGSEGNPYVITGSDSIQIISTENDSLLFKINVFENSDLFEKEPNLNTTLNANGEDKNFTAEEINTELNDDGSTAYFYRIENLERTQYLVKSIQNPLLTQDDPGNQAGEVINLESYNFSFDVAAPVEHKDPLKGWVIALSIILIIAVIVLLVVGFYYYKDMNNKNNSSKGSSDSKPTKKAKKAKKAN